MVYKNDIEIINNLEINNIKGTITVNINPKIYNISVIFSAAYIFIDKAYVVITGDPENEIFVELLSKDKDTNLESLGRDFNNELLNYAVYFHQSEINKNLKDAIIHKTLLTNEQKIDDNNYDEYSDLKGYNNIDNTVLSSQDYRDDPLGIAKPWSEDKDEKKAD